MSPEKTAKWVTNQLMIVFKEADTTSPTDDERLGAYGFCRAPSEKQYLLKADSYAALDRAAKKLAALTDGYPFEQCVSHLKDIAVGEKDKGTSLGEAHDRMRVKVVDFLRQFEKQGEWEVVFAVREIDANQGQFQIGPCSFYLMDDEQFTLWGQRFSSGQFDPLPGTPVYKPWRTDEAPMKGQVVAAARVRAVNHDHARAKGRNRIEEALNLLRYGQLVVGIPKDNFPEIGFWVRQWRHDHSFVVQIDRPNFGTHMVLGGPEGNCYSVSNKAPGWSGLEQIITLDRAVRTELHLRFTTALQWIGQAALAPANSIRLVALVTALEAMLIGESESTGKKTKLAKRISELVGGSAEEKERLALEVEELYRNRSECVHGGEIEVASSELTRAVRLLARTLEALVAKPPYCTATNLRAILDTIDPPPVFDNGDRLRWVAENAYLRWVTEGKPDNRGLHHWLDAEREYVCNQVLKGRSLSSMGAGKQITPESENDE